MKTPQPLFSGPALGAGKTTGQQWAAVLFLLATAIASAAVRYVDESSASPAPPYATWATAAHTIQDAVDAAVAGDEVVVTNGVYATGGRPVGTNVLVNRVAVDKPLTLRSVNGPQVTAIQGYQVPGTTNGDSAIRCVYLANGASLSGFTLANGANWSVVYGGALNYCCTTPLPTDGLGNITNAPLFVDDAGGNLRLQANSPCINAGNNAYAPGPTDLDGNSRIVRGTVDLGAYEFQGPGSVISYAWLQRYGLPTDGSADATDPDADGHNAWQEWHCLTDPTNALSVLRLQSASHDGTNVTLTWQSVAGVDYFLECSTNLAATPRFMPLATNLLGQPVTTTYTDTNGAGLGPFFYRVGVGD